MSPQGRTEALAAVFLTDEYDFRPNIAIGFIKNQPI